MYKKTLNKKMRRDLSITIAFAIIISSLIGLNISLIPSVSADLDGPYYIRGYINDSTDNAVQNGATVNVTNIDTSYSSTTTTVNGLYQINVGKDTGFNCANNHQIVVRCVNGTEVGENQTTIDTTGTFSWCNLTGDKKLEAKTTSFSINDTNWDNGVLSYNTSNTTSNTYFNLSNDGNVAINLSIYSEDITFNGNTWNLVNDTSTAKNKYSIKYQKNPEATWSNITLVNTSFKTDLQYNSDYFDYTYWQTFGLNFTMPWQNSDKPSSTTSFKVTFWSIEA